MTPAIRELPSSLKSQLQSQIDVVCLTSAIDELIQNSVDAGATHIAVVFDPQTLAVDITDDGCGMTPEDLALVGSPHRTSKIQSVDDLVHCKTYGFQGRALFSISNMAKVTMVSKCADYNGTWIRRLPGRPTFLSDDDTINTLDKCEVVPFHPDSHGTTILIRELLFTIPVRQKLIKEKPLFRTLNKLREGILRILIAHPQITLYMHFINDKHELERFLITEPQMTTGSIDIYANVLRSLYDEVVPKNSLKSLNLKYNDYSINGVISRVPVRTSDLQFITLNGRRYANQKFSREINSLFRDSQFEPPNNTATYVGRPYRYYPLFILEITCPPNFNDMIQTPSKDINEATYKDIIHPLILKLLKSFLAIQGYTSDQRPAKENTLIPSASLSPLADPSQNLLSNIVLSSKIRSSAVSLSELSGRSNTNQQKKITKGVYTPKSVHTLLVEKSTNRNIAKPFTQKLRREEPLETRLPNLTSSECDHEYTDNSAEININKAEFSNAIVINQIDNKFILVKIPSKKQDGIANLFIMDQHACDERVILEDIQLQFLTQISKSLLSLQPTVGMASTISESETHLFEYYKHELNTWGINFEINKKTVDKTVNTTLSITTLPDLILQKYGSHVEFLKGAILQHLDDLQHSRRQQLSQLMKKNTYSKDLSGTTPLSNWPSYINCIPTLLMEIFNSKACRSAIKFGTSLSKTECELLISRLRLCQQPFQCAHGRPSILPLYRLDESIKDDYC